MTSASDRPPATVPPAEGSEEPDGSLDELLGFIHDYYSGASRTGVRGYSDWFMFPTLVDASALPGRIRSDEPLIFNSASEITAWREEMLSAFCELDYGGLEGELIHVWRLNGRVAIFVADVRRLRTDGTEINKSRHLYVVLRHEARWRIFATLPGA